MAAVARGFTPQVVNDLIDYHQAATRKVLISETRRLVALNEQAIMDTFGSPAEIEQTVDGQVGRALDQALKYTDTVFHLHANVVDEALRLLIMRSPIGPGRHGHYKDAHWLYVNGTRRDVQLEGNKVELKRGDKIVIVNVKPYARKIEGTPYQRFKQRMTHRRPGLSVQAPDGVYEVTARDLQKLYGKIAIINFTYRGNVEGALLEQATVARSPKRNRSGRYHSQGGPRSGGDAKDRFPALEIEARF
jgi:hypothetical protein